MAIEVTNTSMLLFDTPYEVEVEDATSTAINTAETFEITPTGADSDVVIIMNNSAAGQGTVTYSVAAGDFFGAGEALTGSIENATKDAIVLKGAKYKDEDGVISITVTPATGKKLLTDHAFSMEVIELP
jgi:hypothetical protein